jgi:Na+-transporting methylmalonyl-CoA/oxaloacetate decarboxylase gamma subunit
MEFSESLLVALFCWAVVFTVLIILFTIIRTFSFALKALPKKAVEVSAAVAEVEEEFSSGALKLKDVDEQTAAMIMAIVSDESGIPLSELIFKSIKQIAA